MSSNISISNSRTSQLRKKNLFLDNNYQSNLNSNSNNHKLSYSNHDRDDSLYDALSLDLQTPFRFDDDMNNLTNQDINLETSSKLISNISGFINQTNQEENFKNRYSLIDLELTKSKNYLSKEKKNSAKETSKDEILLIEENSSASRVADLVNIQQSHQSRRLTSSKSPSKIPGPANKTPRSRSRNSLNSSLNQTNNNNINTSYNGTSKIPVLKSHLSPNNKSNPNNTDDLKYFLEFRRPEKTPSPNKFSNNNSFNKEIIDMNLENNQKLTQDTRTNIEKLRERINSINLNNKNNQETNTPKSDLIEGSDLNSQKKDQNEGAFKIYTTKKEFKPEKQEQKRGPVKKYRSGSTSNLNVSSKANNKTDTNANKSNPKQNNSERIRPSTQTDINYTLDSDESTIIDNLINDPGKLKQRLKQGKIDREHLNQLQKNYEALLEQYAEAENFIDAFRLQGAQIFGTNNSNSRPGSLVTNESKNQINSGFFNYQQQKYFIQPSIHSSTSTLYSNQQINFINIDQTQNTTPIGTNSNNTPSDLNTQVLFKTNSINNIQSNENLKTNQQPTVFIIQNNNLAPTQLNIEPVQQENLANNSLNNSSAQISSNNSPGEDLLIDPNSKLGILLQMKILQDKMQSFLTLVDENQLNRDEQKQVYVSIKNDYQSLIKNYQEVKKSDSNNVLPEELDMDVDLNKELGKMKDLLNDIVEKMNHNIMNQSTGAGSEFSDEKESPNESSLSSYDNRDQMVDQYNRLLDVFKDESYVQSNENLQDTQKKQNNYKVSSESIPSTKSITTTKHITQLENVKLNNNNNNNNNIRIDSSSDLEYNESQNGIYKTQNKQTNKRPTINIISNNINKKSNQMNKQESVEINKPNKHMIKESNLKNRNLKLVKMSNDSETTTESDLRNQINHEENTSEIEESFFEKNKPIFKNQEMKNLNHKRISIHSETESDLENDEEAENDKTLSPVAPSTPRINKKQDYQREFKKQNQISSKKTISLNNLNQYQNEFKKNTKSNMDLKNLPVAKAYEGSESDEDLESFNYGHAPGLKQENVQSTLIKNEAIRKSNLNPNPKFHLSSNQINKKLDTNINKHNAQNNVEILEDFSNSSSEAESVIERKKAISKNTKKDLMKKLTQEVEFLKQEILKKHLSKLSSNSSSSGNENERKRHRSEVVVSNESSHTDYSESEINKRNKNKQKMILMNENKIRRYQSSNDLYNLKHKKISSNDQVVSSVKKKIAPVASNAYNIPIIKEFKRPPPAPGSNKKLNNNQKKKELYYDSSNCLVCLPINNNNNQFKRSTSAVPINFIPLNELDSNLVDDEPELDKNNKNLIINKSSKNFISNDKKLRIGSAQYLKPENKNKVFIPIQTETTSSNASNEQKKTRKVRYYIREYTDISTVSDNEIIYRSDGKLNDYARDKENRNYLNVNEINKQLDRAFTYANSITKKARNIKRKLKF